MPKADKKTRGRSSITETPGARETGGKTHPKLRQVQMVDVNRGQSPGGGNKHRGDRRDMHKTYTGNAKHSARGRTGRANVATRKD
jgi:hypothetical protein